MQVAPAFGFGDEVNEDAPRADRAASRSDETERSHGGESWDCGM